MLKSFFAYTKRVFTFIGMLVLFTLFVGLSFMFLRFYQDQKLNGVYTKEGKVEIVKVSGFSITPHTWTDYFGNVKYISFEHKGKSYSSRYIEDSVFVSEGSLLKLSYHPRYDNFRQLKAQFNSYQGLKSSKLLQWSVLSLWDSEKKYLLGFCAMAVCSMVMCIGLLSFLPGLQRITVFNQWIAQLALLLGALFFTYDSWSYYRYYQTLKSGARTSVVITHTYKEHHKRDTHGNLGWIYTADVSLGQHYKRILISEEEYNQAQNGATLQVFYDSKNNDMVSERFSPGIQPLLLPAFIWLLLLCWIWLKFWREKTQEPRHQN